MGRSVGTRERALNAASRPGCRRGALLLEPGDGFVAVGDRLLELVQLGRRFWRFFSITGALRGVVAIDEVGLEGVEARLQGFGERLVARDVVAKRLHLGRQYAWVFVGSLSFSLSASAASLSLSFGASPGAVAGGADASGVGGVDGVGVGPRSLFV